MILVDTSVLIDFLRSKDAILWQKIVALNAIVTGVVRAEILAGARNARDQTRLLTLLDALPQIATDEAMWDTTGNAAAELRRHGVNVPLADILIASIAISCGSELWTRDQHFGLMLPWMPGLQLYHEPP